MNVRHITSLDHPDLQPYTTLRRPLEHINAGIFVAEGEKVVRRLLDSNLTIVSLLLTREWLAKLFTSDHTYRGDASTVFVADKTLIEQIVGHNLHQGIMAVGRVPVNCLLEGIMGTFSTPHLLVALDGLVNAENVGVVVRNCAAFGVNAVIVGETSSSPYLRRAVRNSMGAVFQMQVVHVTSLVETLRTVHGHYATKIVAAHPHEHEAIGTSDLRGNVCIVLGNEGEGIRPEVLEVCTARVAIPMMNETDSLNVASASAVFLYEVRKQRINLAKR